MIALDRILFAVRDYGRCALAALLLALVVGTLSYCQGRDRERERWQVKVATAEKTATDRARTADEARAKSLATSTEAITKARKDLDNATAHLPDESPSVRRRARLCAELRAEARAGGVAPPACGPVQPR